MTRTAPPATAIETVALETLADGRQLWRLDQPDLAADFRPGLQLLAGARRLPVLRADARQLLVVADTAPAGPLALAGTPLTVPDAGPLLFCSQNDGLFAVLAWLFRHRRQRAAGELAVIASFSGRLPFRPQPSVFLTPQLPAHVTAALPLLDDWQIPSRLCHPDGPPGCHDGAAADLFALLDHPQARQLIVPA